MLALPDPHRLINFAIEAVARLILALILSTFIIVTLPLQREKEK